jgi:hypothetical protein
MKSILNTLIILALFGGKCLGQAFVPPPYTNYYDIVKLMDSSFAAQHEKMDDETFFHEGGAYDYYQEWKQYWEPRIRVFNGDFESYFEYESRIPKEGLCLTDMNPWREIGPTNTPYPVKNGASNGGQEMGVGPIEFIKIHPSSPSNMICGSLYGGLFYTTNSGNFWQNAGSDSWGNRGNTGCSDAVFDPGNPSTCYAISNEGNHGDFIGPLGGVYRTTNLGSGNTWLKIGDMSQLGGWYNTLLKIAVDPLNSNNAVIGTRFSLGLSQGGLYRTTNLNSTSPVWTQVAFNGYTVHDVENKPGTSELFATVNTGNNTWEIWHSANFGLNWTQITFPSSVGLTNVQNLTIEFNSALPNLLYVLVDRISGNCVFGTGPCDEVWKFTISTGNSGSWALKDYGFDVNFGDGHGFGLAQNASSEVIYGGSGDRYRVGDNGTWTTYNSGSGNQYTYHVDVEDFVGHPTNPDEVWMASHGGVYKSTYRGQSWISQSNGLGVAEVMSMANSYGDPGKTLVGLNHDGSQLTQGNYYNNWTPDFSLVGEGDGTQCLIDNINGAYMYTSWQNGNWQSSNDFGVTFSGIPSVGGNWSTEGKLNKIYPNILYRNSGHEVYRSFTRGANPNDVVSNFSGILSSHTIAALYTGYHSGYLYANVGVPYTTANPNYSALFVNKDINNPNPATAAAAWIQLPIPTINTSWCGPYHSFDLRDVVVSYDNPDIVYLAGGYGSIWCAGTNGAEMIYKADYTNPNAPVFTDLTKNLPNALLSRIVLEKGSNGGIYVATSLGVFYTNNELFANETFWECYNTNLPNIVISDMEINYQVNKLRVSTRGRGLWETELKCPSLTNLTESGTYTSDRFIEVQSNIVSTAIVPAGRGITYRAGNQIQLTTGFTANSGDLFHAFIHACDHPGNSFYRNAPQDDNNYMTSEGDAILSEDKSVEIYPNPNDGKFIIRIKDQTPDKLYAVTVTDIIGNTVVDLRGTSEKEIKIDLGNLVNGVYLIKLSSDASQVVRKITVQR